MSPTPPSSPPKLAYLVSAYPAISHTFILREIRRLRELGHTIITASINHPDRASAAMDAYEREEAARTYCLKADGVGGALAALGYWLKIAPGRLLRMLRFGFGISTGGRWWVGLAYAVEAAMVARWMQSRHLQHLHVHFGNVGASIGVLVKRLNGCHLSYTIHGPDEFDDVPGQHLALKMQQADCRGVHQPVCQRPVDAHQPPGPLAQIAGCAGWGWTRLTALHVASGEASDSVASCALAAWQRPNARCCWYRLVPGCATKAWILC